MPQQNESLRPPPADQLAQRVVPIMPDLSTSRVPKTTRYDSPFVRPGAWDKIVPVDEPATTDIDPENLYRAMSRKYKKLSSSETADLASKIQLGKRSKNDAEIDAGEKAKKKLCLHNLTLVPYSLHKLFGMTRGEIITSPALHTLDLIQEGNLGLMRAVDKYDPTTGYKFSSYAVRAIRNSVAKALGNQTSNIRASLDNRTLLRKYRYLLNDLTQELGRAAGAEDVAKALDKPVEPIRDILLLDKLNNAVADVLGEEPLEAFDINADPEEFENDPDNIPTNEISPEIEEALINPRQINNVEEFITTHGRRTAINSALNDLTSQESQIIRLRFGLAERAEDVTFTLKEIGLEFGLSGERIRQIEAKALKKLRRSSSKNRLRGFIED